MFLFTTRTKITFLFTLLVIGIIALLDVVIFQSADHTWQENKKSYITKVMNAMYSPEEAKKQLPHVEITDSSWAIIHRQGVFLETLDTPSPASFWSFLRSDTLESRGKSYILASESKMGMTITTAEDVTPEITMRDDTIHTALWISLIGVIFTSIIGYFFSGYILYPIRVMQDAAEGFSLGKKKHEHHTGIIGHARDEVVLLARSMESLFNRVSQEAEKLEQFSDDIAHEIKNTLFSIQSSLDLALNTEHRDAGITRARNMIQELSGVVDSLLFFSRNETGNTVSTDLYTLISSHIDLTDTRIQIWGSRGVVCDIYPELWMTGLGNIISNAQKFTPSDGTIAIDISDDSVTITDTGVGIHERDLPYIFDRLYKADTARSHGTGYGLGLAIAKRIIEDLHHQKLTVTSKHNIGTQFKIEFVS